MAQQAVGRPARAGPGPVSPHLAYPPFPRAPVPPRRHPAGNCRIAAYLQRQSGAFRRQFSANPPACTTCVADDSPLTRRMAIAPPDRVRAPDQITALCRCRRTSSSVVELHPCVGGPRRAIGKGDTDAGPSRRTGSVSAAGVWLRVTQHRPARHHHHRRGAPDPGHRTYLAVAVYGSPCCHVRHDPRRGPPHRADLAW